MISNYEYKEKYVRNKVKDDEKNSQKLHGSYFSINLIVKIVLFNFSVLT